MKRYHTLFISAIITMIMIMGCLPNQSDCSVKTKHGEPDEKILVAYVYNPQELPDPTWLTHINYAFAHVNDSFDGLRIENPEKLKEITRLKKRYPHLKVLLSVGGWGSGNFSEMAADSLNRLSFASECQRAVEKFNLDGIDIDWEYPTSDMAGISASPDDTNNYTKMMRDIRLAIGPDKLLTQATVATAKYIDFKAIDKYIDFTNVMTYDLGWPPYHNSPLYTSELRDPELISVAEGIQAHLDAGISPDKLVLGMPFYGRGTEDFPHGVDITKAHLLEGYTYHWDPIAMVPYLTDDKTGEFAFGFDNEKSLYIKAKFALTKGLKGAMYWSYGGDNRSGDLRETVYKALNYPEFELGFKTQL